MIDKPERRCKTSLDCYGALAKASMQIGLTTQSRDDNAAFVRYDAA
jgi:hypothetical protein